MAANQSHDDLAATGLLRPLLVLVAAVSIAISVSVLVGFVGAPAKQRFDWRLSAEVATAAGTLLLAMYTAYLAATTRREVAVSVAEQRARDRPIIALSVTEIGGATLEPIGNQRVRTLEYWLKNVGLGPALDVHIRALYRGQPFPAQEIIAVVAPGESVTDRPLSLAALESEGELALEDFELEGDFEDRTRIGRHDVTLLNDQGLRDEQRASKILASKRAWFELMPGNAGETTGVGQLAIYRPTVMNNGPSDASDVSLQLVDEEGQPASGVVRVGRMRGPSQEQVEVQVPHPHPKLSCRVTWRDGLGEQERSWEDVYPALRLPGFS